MSINTQTSSRYNDLKSITDFGSECLLNRKELYLGIQFSSLFPFDSKEFNLDLTANNIRERLAFPYQYFFWKFRKKELSPSLFWISLLINFPYPSTFLTSFIPSFGLWYHKGFKISRFTRTEPTVISLSEPPKKLSHFKTIKHYFTIWRQNFLVKTSKVNRKAMSC